MYRTYEWYSQGISEVVSGATGAVNKSFNEYNGELSAEEYVKNLIGFPHG